MADVNLACKSTQVVTFNMHGFNQGAALLLELGLSADVMFLPRTLSINQSVVPT